MKSICVFCGSNPGNRPDYLEAAEELGLALAHRRITLVYGGASVGLMGRIADTVLQHNGKVIGVIPDSLLDKEFAHPNLSELIIVKSMHERKANMFELSDGFVAMPGGIGTLEEIFEVLTWSQMGLHKKPCAALNTSDYYNHLIGFLDHAVNQGFVKPEHKQRLIIHTTADALLDLMQS